MGSVEHDLRVFEAEQEKAFARDDYAIKHRGRWFVEAFEEELQEEFAVNLSLAADHLEREGAVAIKPFVEAYKAKDDAELGRLVRRILTKEIENNALYRAENMAAEEFDGLGK